MTDLSNLPAATAQVLDGVLEDFARTHHVPGLMFGLVADGALRWSKAIGLADRERRRPVTVDTRFRIASMTKNTTALAVLMLRDAGKVALDAPAATYVPELAKLKLPTADSAPVTLRDLLTHSAGLVTDDPWGDRQLGISPKDFTRMLTDGHLFARPPRIAFEYSNLGYAILGRVITNVTGQRYQDFIGDSILRPLGMHATGFDFHAAPETERATGYRWAHESWSPEAAEADGEFGAMGGLLTSAADYARYVAFLLSAWPPRDDAEAGPVRRASVREMALYHAPPYQPDGPEPRPTAYGYGLMNAIDRRLGRLLHHPGGLPGYGSHVLLLPDRGWGVFAFANRTYAPMSKLTPRLAQILDEALPKRPVAPSPALERAIDAAAMAYASGRIEDVADACAPNLLLDMPPPLRNAELADLKKRLGAGTVEEIEPRHALAGSFTLACARGRLKVTVVLSPERRPGIQKLDFDVEGAQGGEK